MSDITILPPGLQDGTGGNKEAWAGRIAASWQKSVEAIFETGRLIAEAKAALPHGAFTAMIETDLPFGARTAQRLMTIAVHPVLSNPAHVSVLPPSWGTLYELAKLDADTLTRRLSDGSIKPDMQRREVGAPGDRAALAGRVQPAGLDFFPTPPWGTRALIEVVLEHLGVSLEGKAVIDPACGEGHITGVIAEYPVDRFGGYDIHDYSRTDADGEVHEAPGWVGFTSDFLAEDVPFDADWVIMNPPFYDEKSQTDRPLEFVRKALEVAREGVAMLVPLRWIEGVDRYETLFKDRPPTLVAQFAERLNLCEGKWDPFGSTATAYCWLVWVADMAPQPTFWIPPGQRKRYFYADDQERFTAHPVKGPRTDDLQVHDLPPEPDAGQSREFTVGNMKARYRAKFAVRRNDDGTWAHKVDWMLATCGGAGPFRGAHSTFADALARGLFQIRDTLAAVRDRHDSVTGDAERIAARHGAEWCESKAREWGLSAPKQENGNARNARQRLGRPGEEQRDHCLEDDGATTAADTSAPAAGNCPATVTAEEFKQYKALYALASGIGVTGPVVSTLQDEGFVHMDGLTLTHAGMDRAEYLHARVRAAANPDDPDAIRVEKIAPAPLPGMAQIDDPAYHWSVLINGYVPDDPFVWTDAAVKILEAGYRAQRGAAEIAEVLGATPGAVFGKANRLGITDKARQGGETRFGGGA